MSNVWMQTEWTAREGYLPALSIQQPFVKALVMGKKSIEIRRWGTHYHGAILLQSGKLWDGMRYQSEPELRSALWTAKPFVRRLDLPRELSAYPLGAIVGCAKLVRCAKFTEEGWERTRELHQHNGYWAEWYWGWQFEELREFAEPIPYRGQLGLFPVEEALIAAQMAVQS